MSIDTHLALLVSVIAIYFQQPNVRLAQLVERYIDIVEVTSSSLVSDTTIKLYYFADFAALIADSLVTETKRNKFL